ncbi:MAG: hypothetical protein V4812_00345 [Pseudomonadota bacterium]
MSLALDLLALSSAWLVMLGLALSAPRGKARVRGAGTALLLGYLLPGLGLWLLAGLGMAPAHLQGLALCLAAGFGTSGAALHRLAGGDGRQAAHLVIGSSLLAVLLVPLSIACLGGPQLEVRVLGQVLLACLLGQTLPYLLGRLLLWRAPALSHRLAAPLERLASAAVLLVIALVALQTLARLGARPELLLAAILLVALLLLARLDRRSVAAGNPQVLLLVRNLGGAILVARVLPEPAEVLLAIAAFGLPMYGVALLGLALYRRPQASAGP